MTNKNRSPFAQFQFTRAFVARTLSPLAISVLLSGNATPAVAEPGTADAATRDSERVAFFEKKIRPLLSSHCYQCHSADTKPSGGLRVDDRNGLLVGGDN